MSTKGCRRPMEKMYGDLIQYDRLQKVGEPIQQRLTIMQAMQQKKLVITVVVVRSVMKRKGKGRDKKG